MTELRTFAARDGVRLAYRLFPAAAPRGLLVFLHGGSHDGRRGLPVARALVRAGYTVALPDLRGHGESGEPRGHCARVGQPSDDLEDLLDELVPGTPGPLYLGGHSSGAMVVLRYLSDRRRHTPAAVVLVAPTMPSAPEASRFDSRIGLIRHWLTHLRPKRDRRPLPARAARVMPKLSLAWFALAQLFPALRHRTVLTFPAAGAAPGGPPAATRYSYNMMASVTVRNVPEALSRVPAPVLLVIGADDEATDPRALASMARWELKSYGMSEVVVLPRQGHLGVLVGAPPFLVSWLARVAGDGSKTCGS